METLKVSEMDFYLEDFLMACHLTNIYELYNDKERKLNPSALLN